MAFPPSRATSSEGTAPGRECRGGHRPPSSLVMFDEDGKGVPETYARAPAVDRRDCRAGPIGTASYLAPGRRPRVFS